MPGWQRCPCTWLACAAAALPSRRGTKSGACHPTAASLAQMGRFCRPFVAGDPWNTLVEIKGFKQGNPLARRRRLAAKTTDAAVAAVAGPGTLVDTAVTFQVGLAGSCPLKASEWQAFGTAHQSENRVQQGVQRAFGAGAAGWLCMRTAHSSTAAAYKGRVAGCCRHTVRMMRPQLLLA